MYLSAGLIDGTLVNLVLSRQRRVSNVRIECSHPIAAAPVDVLCYLLVCLHDSHHHACDRGSSPLTSSALLFSSLPHSSSCPGVSVRKHQRRAGGRPPPGDGLGLLCPTHTCPASARTPRPPAVTARGGVGRAWGGDEGSRGSEG